MKNNIINTGLVLVIAFLAMACDSYPSLQKYYVDSKENREFISVDIPASIVSLKDTDASDEIKETLKSIRKINFLGFQLKDENATNYSEEQAKVKEILKNPKYQELMRLSDQGKSLAIKYVGEDNAIDEVILYGSDKELGFALVRILGKNMDPSKMMALATEIQLNNDSGSMNQVENFFKTLQ